MERQDPSPLLLPIAACLSSREVDGIQRLIRDRSQVIVERFLCRSVRLDILPGLLRFVPGDLPIRCWVEYFERRLIVVSSGDGPNAPRSTPLGDVPRRWQIDDGVRVVCPVPADLIDRLCNVAPALQDVQGYFVCHFWFRYSQIQ